MINPSVRAATTILLALIVTTSGHAVEAPTTIQTAPKVSPTPIQPQPALACGIKGYTCGTGFTCTTNTAALGSNPDPQATLLYACTPASAPTSCTLCPPGWSKQGTAPDGSFSCKPVSASCKNAVPLPAGGGYYCGIWLSG